MTTPKVRYGSVPRPQEMVRLVLGSLLEKMTVIGSSTRNARRVGR